MPGSYKVCAVKGCKNNSVGGDVSFFRLPQCSTRSKNDYRYHKLYARRQAWLKALNLPLDHCDLGSEKKDLRICSEHFHSGKLSIYIKLC